MGRGPCAGKVKFPTAWHARRSMNRMIKSGRVLGECQPYPCKTCGGWHWGRVRGTRFDRAAQTIAAIDRALAKDADRKDKGSQHG